MTKFKENTNQQEIRDRLNEFAEFSKTKAPKKILDKDGVPTAEILAYCDKHDLSLDWLLLGEGPHPTSQNGQFLALMRDLKPNEVDELLILMEQYKEGKCALHKLFDSLSRYIRISRRSYADAACNDAGLRQRTVFHGREKPASTLYYRLWETKCLAQACYTASDDIVSHDNNQSPFFGLINALERELATILELIGDDGEHLEYEITGAHEEKLNAA